MKQETIKSFWEQNPCGEHLIQGRSEDLKQFFRQYDEFRYRTEGHILEQLDSIDFQGKNVLEIGVGQGADAEQIVKRGGIYHGLDMTEEACTRVRARFEAFDLSHKEVKCGRAEAIPFEPKHFDIIYSHGVLHHIPEIDKVIPELRRVLKPGGRLVIMLYARNSLNYWLSILILRRILFLGLLLLDLITLKKIIAKPLLRKHLDNAYTEGLIKYLSSPVFLSRNTDGPDNPYSRVYSPEEVRVVFEGFEFDSFHQHFLNERQLPIANIFPKSWRIRLAAKWGWHLWCYAHKKGT